MDPIAPLGFSLAILSFAFNHVPKLLDNVEEVVRCEEILESQRQRLGHAKQRIENWRHIWWDERHESYNPYKELWGESQYELNVSRLHSIRRLSNHIYYYLTGVRHKAQPISSGSRGKNLPRVRPNDFNGDVAQIRAWLGLEQFDDLDITNAQLEQKSILKKIWFALDRRERLDRMLNDLLEKIDQLDYACRTSIQRQGFWKGGELTKAAVGQRLKFIRICRFCAALYQKLKESSTQFYCTFDLFNRNGDTFWSLIDDARLMITLQRRRQNVNQEARPRRLSISQQQHRPEPNYPSLNQTSIRELMFFEVAGNLQFEDYIYRVEEEVQLNYEEISIRDRIVDVRTTSQLPTKRDILDYRFELSQVCIDLTIWFSILWPTEWFQKVCSCKLHRVTGQDDNDDIPGHEEHPRHAFRPWSEGQLPHSCLRNGLDDDPLQYLGVVLAELILSNPISNVSDTAAGFRFEMQYARPQEQFDAQDLISKIKRASSWSLAEAVRHCFFGLPDDKEQPPNCYAEASDLADLLLTPLFKWQEGMQKLMN